MCSDTKQKIAQTLHQLMLERPFAKITVQNLMDRTQMKRQTFYYHFQDTRDVLYWICQQQLAQPLTRSELEFEDWIVFGMKLLDQDRLFYRRVVEAGQMPFLHDLAWKVIGPRVSVLLYGTGEPDLLEQRQQFVVDFCVRGILSYVEEFTCSRRAMDERSAREHVKALLGVLRLAE